MYAYSPVAAHEYCQELHQSFYQRTEYPTNSRVTSERNTGEPEKWTLQKIKPEVFININISECSMGSFVQFISPYATHSILLC